MNLGAPASPDRCATRATSPKPRKTNGVPLRTPNTRGPEEAFLARRAGIAAVPVYDSSKHGPLAVISFAPNISITRLFAKRQLSRPTLLV